jgi:hypothetical protein
MDAHKPSDLVASSVTEPESIPASLQSETTSHSTTSSVAEPESIASSVESDATSPSWRIAKAEEPKRNLHPAEYYILNGLHPTVVEYAWYKGYGITEVANLRRGCREKKEEEGVNRLTTILSMPHELATFLRYCQRSTTR